MLTIRLQRTGRSGHAQFRMVVQDSRFSPTSGRVVAYVGSYNPHSKEAKIDVEKISAYLTNGAQPSPRVVKLLKQEKVKLPAWVKEPAEKKRAVRNPEKRRSTMPEQPAEAEAPAEASAEEAPATQEAAEADTSAVPEAADAEPSPEATPAADASEAEATPAAKDTPADTAPEEPVAEQ